MTWRSPLPVPTLEPVLSPLRAGQRDIVLRSLNTEIMLVSLFLKLLRIHLLRPARIRALNMEEASLRVSFAAAPHALAHALTHAPSCDAVLGKPLVHGDGVDTMAGIELPRTPQKRSS